MHKTRPTRPGPMVEFPELAAIEDYRLEHNLTWQQLGDEFRRVGAAVSYRTLHNACKHDALNERTLFRVQKFLRAKRITPRPRRRRVPVPPSGSAEARA